MRQFRKAKKRKAIVTGHLTCDRKKMLTKRGLEHKKRTRNKVLVVQENRIFSCGNNIYQFSLQKLILLLTVQTRCLFSVKLLTLIVFRDISVNNITVEPGLLQ